MKIKHLPNSITPYENCGYCRVPEQPITGEEILIYCRIEEKKDNVGVPKLQLIVNGIMQEKVLEGIQVKSDEKGEYYSFSIGAYQSGDSLSYQFSCRVQEQMEYSDWYEFEILDHIVYTAPTSIFYQDKSILLLFSKNEAEYFTIKLQLQEEKIEFGMEQTITPPDKVEQLKHNRTWTEENYTVQVELVPFSLSVVDAKGLTLVQYRENDHKLNLYIGTGNVVKKITFQGELLAKGLYGFGEKYNRVNQIGLQTKNYVYEHFTHQEEKTYLPVPFFISDAGYGFFYDTDYPMNFSMGQKEDKVLLTVDTVTNSRSGIDDFTLFFGEPQKVLQQYIDKTGCCVLPPKWSFGPWMSANGWNTQKETLEQIDKMNLYEIPATVLVLEAWSDETTFYIFNDAEYTPKKGEERLTYEDFHFPEDGKWPNPKEMIQTLHENNVKLVLWQIPVIKDMENQDNVQHASDEAVAIEKGYCVKDRKGEPYRITDKWFANSLVPDFTSKEAKEWWFSKRRYLVEELHVDGFKTDGGEFIYDNQVVFSNGKSGEELRNPYPNYYVEGYHEFLGQYLGEGQGVAFSRAGYKGAQRMPIHWAGDQMSEYSEFRAQVKAGLSAGLSGIIFWGFDIAGFAGDLPTTDLFLRSAAMATFSPIMQFHAEPRTGQFFLDKRRSWNNDRSPWNMAEVNEEPKVLEIYKKFANIRMNLMPYLYNEAIYCSDNGRPMFAHLILDYPMDERVVNIEDEYLFGRSLLIAPILHEGEKSRTIYLPKGTWHDFFRGEIYEGNKEIEYSCSFEEIPVFVKDGHALCLNLSDRLQLGDFVGNDLDHYHQFAIKTFGEKGSLAFKDDLGNDFVMNWSGKDKTMDGTYPENCN